MQKCKLGNNPAAITTSDYRFHTAENSVSRFVFTFEVIGTQWKIETYDPLDSRLQQRIFDRIQQFDATYSRFRPDSLVSCVAAAPNGGCFNFPNDSIALFDLYDRLHKATKGAVDPLVGRDLELLGYDPTYSLAPVFDITEMHDRGRATWSRDIIRDGTSLVTQRPQVIDVGAAGKGYLVDIISEILRETGFTQFIVDGSGDLRHLGEWGIQVGLEHPFDPQMVIGVVNLQNRALCASAVNRRAWGDNLHHVLDARTGVPVQDVVATWVVADDAATADGLATALFFTSAEHLAESFQFSYVRMFADGRAEISQNFDGKLFSKAHPSAECIPVNTDRVPIDRAAQLVRKGEGMATLIKRMKVTLAGISVALLIGCSTTGTEVMRPMSTSNADVSRSRSASSQSTYADGVYRATGQYGGGPSFITVTATLENNVVTAVEVTPHATDPTSLDYQRRFAAAVPEVVVGKRIDEVNVGRLAGSSGTPNGFNAAIQRIKEQSQRSRATSE
jgi:FAD:protein FMN transferase